MFKELSNQLMVQFWLNLFLKNGLIWLPQKRIHISNFLNKRDKNTNKKCKSLSKLILMFTKVLKELKELKQTKPEKEKTKKIKIKIKTKYRNNKISQIYLLQIVNQTKKMI